MGGGGSKTIATARRTSPLLAVPVLIRGGPSGGGVGARARAAGTGSTSLTLPVIDRQGDRDGSSSIRRR